MRKRAKSVKLEGNLDEQYKVYKRYYTHLKTSKRRLKGDAMQSKMMSKETFKRFMELQTHTAPIKDSIANTDAQAAAIRKKNRASELNTFNQQERWEYEYKRSKLKGKKSYNKFLEDKLKDLAYKQYHGTTFTRAQARHAASLSKKALRALEAGAVLDDGDLFQAFIADYGPKYEKLTGESRLSLFNLNAHNIISKKVLSLFNQ